MQDLNLGTLLPLYDTVPDDWESAKGMLVESLKQIISTLNTKESGYLALQEVLSCGLLFTNTNNTFRQIFRKVVDFGALPNNTTKNVAHGIAVDSNFRLVNLYLSATNPTALTSFSLQYWSNSATDDIKLNLTSTNVVVVTKSNYSSYTSNLVVIEYVKEI